MVQSAAQLDVAEFDATAVKNFTCAPRRSYKKGFFRDANLARRYTLAHVTGNEEAQLLAGLEERQVVQKAVNLARQQV